MTKKYLSTAIYTIKKIKTLAGKKLALVAYHSLMASHIQNGIIAWGSASNTYLEEILNLQKKSIRIIDNLPYNEHCKPYFKQNLISWCNKFVLVSFECSFYKYDNHLFLINTLYMVLRVHTFILQFKTIVYIQETILYVIQDQSNCVRSELDEHNQKERRHLSLLYKRLKKPQNHLDYIDAKFFNNLPQHIKFKTILTQN